eukprot:jgi/Picsp_1/4226/NSC_01735-R1_---NA---
MDAILDLNVSKVEFMLKQGAKIIINYSEDGGCDEESTINLLCSTMHQRFLGRERGILLDIAKLLVRYHSSSVPYWRTCKADYGILKMLLENGCYINGGSEWQEDNLDFTPMHVALSRGDREVVEFIANYDDFYPNPVFYTALSNYV